MNKIILMGRLVKDPEVRTVSGGPNGSFQVTRFTLAVDRPRSKGQQQSEADFINCEASGTKGENIAKYLGKGRKILIYGNWRTGSYTSQTGAKVYTNTCNVQEWEFADSNPSQSGNQQGGYRNQQQGGYQNQQQGGYQNQQQGAYQNQQQGGYQNQQQGGYQNQQQGGYQNQQQTGYGNDGFLPAGLDDELPFN